MRQDPLSYLADELDALKQQGLYRRLRVLDGEQKAHDDLRPPLRSSISRRTTISGLTTHPTAARARARGDRSGSASAPARCGRSPARWRSTWSSSAGSPSSRRPKRSSSSRAASPRTPAPSSAILTKDDVVVSDELNHASIIDGCRLSRATIKVFPHKDVDAARKILAGAAGRRSASCSSPTACSAWTATSARCRSCASWPKSSAAS